MAQLQAKSNLFLLQKSDTQTRPNPILQAQILMIHYLHVRHVLANVAFEFSGNA